MSPTTDIDKYPFSYLPPSVASHFHQALGCYQQGLLQSFAAMCRLTAQAIFLDVGEGAKLRIFDQVEEIAQLAGIEDIVYRDIRDILFDTDQNSLHYPDGMDRETAVVLLETMKDILHQYYIRRALLRKKLKMRRFFAAQSDHEAEAILNDPKVAPLKKNTGSE